MWLTSSSIGRKLVMAITGACLVLFVTFHAVMNAVALLWPMAYNAVCEFLGANWYALVATVGLAALFVIHIIYALWLTIQNRRARGTDRYAVTSRPPQVEWSSKNMLVLGIVVLAFLAIHMIQFWAKMQLAEILHCDYIHDGVEVPAAAGTLFLNLAFSQAWTPVVYIIGLIALWFHLNHGFWSMFQTAGWSGRTWMPRLQKIGCWWTTIVVALFIAEAVVFTIRANTTDFNTELREYRQWKADGCAGEAVQAECANAPFHGDCDGKALHGDCARHAAEQSQACGRHLQECAEGADHECTKAVCEGPDGKCIDPDCTNTACPAKK